MIVRPSLVRNVTRVALALATLVLVAAPARAQSPNFDAVPWAALTCDVAPLSPGVIGAEIEMVGDTNFPAVYTARDGSYLYFRYRLDGDPAGVNGFKASAWTVLVQVATGNAYQFQYQLSLSGEGLDPLQIWANSTPLDFDFDNPTADDSETLLWSQDHAVLDPVIGNTAPLARSLPVTDGSAFKNNPDFFLDLAFPIAALVQAGVVTAAEQLDAALFYPATASRPDRHNRDRLNCPFLPGVPLVIEHDVSPVQILSNVTTPVRYTIQVRNEGTRPARGLTIKDGTLPPYLSSITVSPVSDDPAATPSVVSTSPITVRVPELAAGKTVTVLIDANALAGCGTGSTATLANARATNGLLVLDAATLQVIDQQSPEVCDGLDNNCNGTADEGGDALCNDGNACTGVETCGGQAGCQNGPPVDCGDGNPCTTDTCAPATGACGHTPIPGCVGCQNNLECADGDPCTTDVCSQGACTNPPLPNCRPCTTPAQCDDENACTTDTCTVAGICNSQPIGGCIPCTAAAQCNDGNGCTADTCGSGGTCDFTPITGCEACTTAADCNDQDACTADACPAGACTHTPVEDCCVPALELCSDTLDNDCDGDSDCADADCSSEPACAPAPETCGNCVDDDGDGLVDWEDAECCGTPLTLAVAQMTLKPPPARVQGDRLRLTAIYAAVTPPLFDPMTQDTSLQVSDASGTLLCTTLPAGRWKRGKGLSTLFKDKSGQVAGGLRSGRFSVNRRGNLVFDARGRKVALRAVSGSTVRVTVRVGGQCSRSEATLRQQKKGLVFP